MLVPSGNVKTIDDTVLAASACASLVVSARDSNPHNTPPIISHLKLQRCNAPGMTASNVLNMHIIGALLDMSIAGGINRDERAASTAGPAGGFDWLFIAAPRNRF